jgi:hypothetical protein
MIELDNFRKNLSEVERLVNFDKELLQFVTQAIEELHGQLKEKFADERMNGGRTLKVIQGIRENESIQRKYEAIFNQAVVLMISHLSSALGDLFRNAVSTRLQTADAGKLLDEEIKLTLGEMREKDWNLKTTAADLLVAKHDFSFQDMGSTVRAFKQYVDVLLVRDEAMNNIIAAQACRHVIVHASGRITERAIKQLSAASPRTLKQSIVLNEIVLFSAAEVDALRKDMLKFVEKLANDISQAKL